MARNDHRDVVGGAFEVAPVDQPPGALRVMQLPPFPESARAQLPVSHPRQRTASLRTGVAARARRLSPPVRRSACCSSAAAGESPPVGRNSAEFTGVNEVWSRVTCSSPLTDVVRAAVRRTWPTTARAPSIRTTSSVHPYAVPKPWRSLENLMVGSWMADITRSCCAAAPRKTRIAGPRGRASATPAIPSGRARPHVEPLSPNPTVPRRRVSRRSDAVRAHRRRALATCRRGGSSSRNLRAVFCTRWRQQPRRSRRAHAVGQQQQSSLVGFSSLPSTTWCSATASSLPAPEHAVSSTR